MSKKKSQIDMNAFYSLSVVASIVGYSESHLRRLCRDNRIEYQVQYGVPGWQRYLVRPVDMQEYIQHAPPKPKRKCNT